MSHFCQPNSFSFPFPLDLPPRPTNTRTPPIVSPPSELHPPPVSSRAAPFVPIRLTCLRRFEFKGKDPKFRIETPSRVIHSLKTPVSQEISGLQKIQIKSALIRVVKRFGVSPPQKVRVVVGGAEGVGGGAGCFGLLLFFVTTSPAGVVPNRQTRAASLVPPHLTGAFEFIRRTLQIASFSCCRRGSPKPSKTC